MTTTSNLYIDQGVDFNIDIDIYGSDGAPIDVSQYTFFGDVKKMYTTFGVAFSFTIAINPLLASNIDISLLSDDTINATPGKYQYDIIMVSPTGSRTKLIEGLLFLLSTVTTIEG